MTEYLVISFSVVITPYEFFTLGFICKTFCALSANGAFFRTELTRTDYEDVTFLGSFNGNAAGDSAVRNKVDANVDATALRVSFGKSF